MRTAALFLLSSLFFPLSASAQDADAERIAQLIRDLGADDFKAREAAEQELRRIGAPAAPALKKALEDKDAERADRARRILKDIESAPPDKEKRATSGVRISSRDLSRGVTFDLYPDGRVELTVPEEDKDTGKKVYRTYKAGSLEEFKEKHPEIAKQYEIDRFLPRVEWKPLDAEEFDKWWQDWKRQFDEDWLRGREDWFKEWRSPLDDDLKKWLEEQRRSLEEFRRRFKEEGPAPQEPPPAEKKTPTPGGEFGLKIEPVNETLAAQLELKEGEGVQVAEVKAGSAAEKAGLQKHDVIHKLNGAAIADKWEFRRKVRELLGTPFELEIIRNGKRETVGVK